MRPLAEVLHGCGLTDRVGRDFIPHYRIGLPLPTPDGRIGQAIGALEFALGD